MKMKAFVLILTAFTSLNIMASDPSISVYKSTTVTKDKDDSGNIKKDANGIEMMTIDGGQENINREIRFFSFAKTDSIFGSLAVSQSGDAQTVKFNVVNYNLWFGGNYKLPFQLYISETANDSSDDSNQDKNELSVLDPESGVAIKFPLLWVYQSNGSEPCAFLGKSDIGHCAFGGDITFSLKNLEDIDGKTETAFGKTIRVGGSVLFPVLDSGDNSEQGYLSAAAKLVYSHTNIDDPTQLFTPVLDAEGNPVNFDNSLLSGELELKFAINGQLSISARWLAPFDNKDYFDDRFQLILESQF